MLRLGRLEFLYKSNLPHRAIAVYLYLYDRADRDGKCFPAIPTIAQHIGLSQSTVRRAIKDLCTAGFLTVSERHRANGADSSNLYLLYHRPP